MNNIPSFAVFHKKLSYKEKCLEFLNEQIFYIFGIFQSCIWSKESNDIFCIQMHNLLTKKTISYI